MNDKALFPQLGGKPGRNPPLRPLRGETIGAHQDERAARCLLVTHNGQLRAADLAYVMLELGGRLASVLIGRGGDDDGGSGPPVLHEDEMRHGGAGLKSHA